MDEEGKEYQQGEFMEVEDHKYESATLPIPMIDRSTFTPECRGDVCQWIL